MSLAPPEVMATWPAPNYVNPSTMVPATLGSLLAGMVLMLMFVAARLYIRLNLAKGFGMDDYCIMVGVLAIIGTTVLATIHWKYGAGYHVWDFKMEWYGGYQKISLAATTLFNVNVTFPKLSLCFTYLRIFPSKANRMFCYLMIAFLLGFMISMSLVTIFQCLPVQSFWDLSVPPTVCINRSGFSIAAGALNSATDFLIYWWPSRALWKIQQPLKTRLGLVFVFSVGSLISIVGVLRAWYIHLIFIPPKVFDLFYEGNVIWILGGIEWNLGMIFSCFHGIKPILAKVFPRIFGTTQGSSAAAGYSGGRSKKFSNRSSVKKSFQTLPTESITDLGGSQSKSQIHAMKSFDSASDDMGGIELPSRAVKYTREITVQSNPRDEDERHLVHSGPKYRRGQWDIV
ncbi:hypothetical protein P152DRAFT_107089 [Eremomyces bilateralis CBS 781.70]|uniref:Rhodopsin domain-containing protein n=1 Tax=Eremomyces bilateralis CBS 781.70 TaxID=1392243 RepID=A0A6G1FWY4_9PEZI|nr:uncharacterized protein P152DRAFT_107089 [Eremomyces bilateralis CBS 781.70]KAF1810284.1 hypothetical protein P152DRAFT_107089 [Eremomyces bilateralis CBS 781.70]